MTPRQKHIEDIRTAIQRADRWIDDVQRSMDVGDQAGWQACSYEYAEWERQQQARRTQLDRLLAKEKATNCAPGRGI